MEESFSRDFTKCPSCGSENKFLGQLGEEMVERKLARPDWRFYYDVRSGPVIDPAKAAALPVGITVPGFVITTDICMSCGCIYATHIERATVKSHMVQAPKPNRPLPPFFGKG